MIPIPQIKPSRSGHGAPLIASTVALVEAVNSGDLATIQVATKAHVRAVSYHMRAERVVHKKTPKERSKSAQKAVAKRRLRQGL